MSLQDKIIAHFEGKVVRKDLSKSVKGNAVVPTYVLEYLLGQHCASFDEDIINDGLHKVKDIIKNNFVHRDEAEMIKSHVRERGNYRLIDKITVKLNEKRDIYEASFSNLGINAAKIDDETVKKHPKLLTGGVWSIITLGYFFSDDKAAASPWIIENLKPIQISSVNMGEFKEARPYFTKHDEIDKEKARTTKELLDRLCAAFENTDLKVLYQFDLTLSFHARSIETDTAWKISIDRGLDIFQMYNAKDVFALENMRQEARAIKGFEVSYLKIS